jgi:hypothetical protein
MDTYLSATHEILDARNLQVVGLVALATSCKVFGESQLSLDSISTHLLSGAYGVAALAGVEARLITVMSFGLFV